MEDNKALTQHDLDTLVHFGILGMKWGVRKDPYSGYNRIPRPSSNSSKGSSNSNESNNSSRGSKSTSSSGTNVHQAASTVSRDLASLRHSVQRSREVSTDYSDALKSTIKKINEAKGMTGNMKRAALDDYMTMYLRDTYKLSTENASQLHNYLLQGNITNMSARAAGKFQDYMTADELKDYTAVMKNREALAAHYANNLGTVAKAVQSGVSLAKNAQTIYGMVNSVIGDNSKK